MGRPIDVEYELRKLSDDTMEKVDDIFQNTELTPREFALRVAAWFGGDFADAYQDWVTEGDQ